VGRREPLVQRSLLDVAARHHTEQPTLNRAPARYRLEPAHHGLVVGSPTDLHPVEPHRLDEVDHCELG
jgi:hypothetical protein